MQNTIGLTAVVLRHHMLARRHRLAAIYGPVVAKELARSALHLLEYYSRWNERYRCGGRGLVVAGYWPMASEVDVRPLLWRLSCLGCRTALPVVSKKPVLVFRVWSYRLLLENGPYGTHHPPAGIPQVIPDVILVPLLAFDSAGFRLGFGAGYYDRTLALLRRRRRGRVFAIGIAFAEQEVSRVPRHRHDVPLDLVWRV